MENILFPRGSRMIPNCPVMVFGQVRDAVVAPFDLNWDMFYPQLGFAIPRQYTADLEDFVNEIDHYFHTILGFVNHQYFNPYKYGVKILVESTGGGKKVHWILLQIARLTDHPPK